MPTRFASDRESVFSVAARCPVREAPLDLGRPSATRGARRWCRSRSARSGQRARLVHRRGSPAAGQPARYRRGRRLGRRRPHRGRPLQPRSPLPRSGHEREPVCDRGGGAGDSARAWLRRGRGDFFSAQHGGRLVLRERTALLGMRSDRLLCTAAEMGSELVTFHGPGREPEARRSGSTSTSTASRTTRRS